MTGSVAPQAALKYATAVGEDGQVVLRVPLPRGTRVVVFVIEEAENDEFADLTAAAGSSTAFWDNPFDDADWNEDRPGA